MVGIQGCIGSVEQGPPHSSLSFAGDERVDRFAVDDLALTVRTYEGGGNQEPYTAPGSDTHWWVWGRVYGIDFPDGTEPVPAGNSARACAEFVERNGASGAERLNGTFLAVGYDTDDNRATVVTDRIGSRPLYYARTDDGIVFSTHVQTFAAHPEIDTRVDREMLAEYGALGRATGLYTPFEGVKTFPPSSVVTVDADSLDVRTESYWSPRHDPADISFEAAAERYANLLERVMAERLVPGRTYGFLVSGGSDSRLLLDIATDILPEEDVVAYHLSDWMSDEARAAERAALTAGVEFRWLRRRADSQERTLSLAPRMMNFYGRAEQAHTAEFTDRLRQEVDCLVSGLYADTLFKGYTLPRHRFDLGPLGTFHSLTVVPTRSVDDYLQRYPESPPDYVDVDGSLREMLRARLDVAADGTVTDHGVTYPSLRDLSMYVDVYPLWNDADLFYWGLEQTMPHWTPFLDNRVLAFAMSVPLRYQTRRNLSNAALRHRESPLAEYPLSASRLSPTKPFLGHFIGERITSLVRRFTDAAQPPQPHYTHHPWTDIGAVLDHKSFVGDVLYRRQSDIRESSFLDWQGVLDCCRGHLDGDVESTELYTLLSFLEMPAFEAQLSERPADTEETVRPSGSTNEPSTPTNPGRK